MQGEEKSEKVNLEQEVRECEQPDEFACKECDGQEVERIKTVRSPTEPSKAEREEHNLHHCNYRSWCDACVRGQARDDAHGTITGELAESTIPRVTMDYAFLAEDHKTRTNEDGVKEKAKVSMTILVVIESLCRSV